MPTKISGTQIQDGSISSADIKDNTIKEEDLSVDLQSDLTNMLTVTKDTAINSLNIATLSKKISASTLSYFVDSFYNDELLDSESVNYEIDEINGYIGLPQGGDLSKKETTKAQFDNGSFTNTESYSDDTIDGLIRKTQTIDGGTTQLHDFDNISNVSVEDAVSVGLTSVEGTVFNSTSALQVNIDFSGADLDEEGIVKIDLGSSGTDFSTSKYLKFNLYNPNDIAVSYTVMLEDIYGYTYSFSSEDLPWGYSYQTIVKELSEASSSLYLNHVRYVSFQFLEELDGQVIVDNTISTSTVHYEINSDRYIMQTFVVDENIECQRLRLKLRKEKSDTADPLNIAITNAFGTTLGICSILPDDATQSFEDYYLTLDQEFTLIAGNTYAIKLMTVAASHGWDVNYTQSDTYPDGVLYLNNRAYETYDMSFTIYKPAIVNSIFLDNLRLEATSTYKQTGTFISQVIDLGMVPDSLDTISFTQEGSDDSVYARLRLGDNETLVESASWNSYSYSNGDSISSITPNQYLQYEISFNNGVTSSSDKITDVTINYEVEAGSGECVIISSEETTAEAPTTFILIAQHELNSGGISYSVSRDGKTTWQNVTLSNIGNSVDFITGEGTQLHIKAIITGDAKLYGWSFLCDQEFI